MAFCTNCGKSLEKGARFCTNCGTPAQAAPVATAGATIPDQAAGAAPALAASVEPRSAEVTPIPDTPPIQDITVEPTPSTGYTELPVPQRSSISPFFVIVCVVLVLLIGAGIAGTVYLQRQGRAKADQTQPAEPAPANTSSSSSTSTATPTPAVGDMVRAMHLDDYPGATPVAIATLTGETVVAGFLTRDKPQQVIQFYKVRFPVSSSTAIDGKAELRATLPGGTNIRIQAEPQGTNTQVMILQEN